MAVVFVERQRLNMDMLKQGAQNLKSVGFGAAMPGVRDRVLNVVTGEDTKSQAEKIKALEAEVAMGNKTKQQAKAELGMKKGGKVSSASKRADGCAIRGKTRA
jgi:hypothetical protein